MKPTQGPYILPSYFWGSDPAWPPTLISHTDLPYSPLFSIRSLLAAKQLQLPLPLLHGPQSVPSLTARRSRGALKLPQRVRAGDWNLQEWKMTDEVAGVEFAGLENDGLEND